MVLSKGTGAYWFVINQTAGFTVSRRVQRTVMSAVEWIARRRPTVNNYRHVAAVAMVTTPFSTKRWLVKRPVTCRYYKGLNTSSTLWNVRDSILTIPLCTLVRQIRAVRPRCHERLVEFANFASVFRVILEEQSGLFPVFCRRVINTLVRYLFGIL